MSKHYIFVDFSFFLFLHDRLKLMLFARTEKEESFYFSFLLKFSAVSYEINFIAS